jgi:hypothetical protein
MATYSKTVAVTAGTYAAVDVTIPFVPKRIRACNMDGGDLAFVSFDGVTDAAALSENVLSPSSCQEWMNQLAVLVWLRTNGSAVQVQIVAEA